MHDLVRISLILEHLKRPFTCRLPNTCRSIKNLFPSGIILDLMDDQNVLRLGTFDRFTKVRAPSFLAKRLAMKPITGGGDVGSVHENLNTFLHFVRFLECEKKIMNTNIHCINYAP